jgi:hypothetical protein
MLRTWFAAACFLVPRVAFAQDCPPLTDSVVVVGSTALRTLVRELAKILAAAEPSSSPPLVYAGLGSCAGVEAMVRGTPLTLETLTYWDGTGAELTCAPAAEVRPDVGISDVFASSCLSLPNGLPSNLEDFLGPVQSMVFAVPQGSTQVTISAEAAYAIYGFGSESRVAPWHDAEFIFQRSPDSGTQAMVASAIGVPSTRWRGTPTTGSSDMLAKLVGIPANKAENTIGILGSAHQEQNRATLRALAYQHFGDTCAVLPNRTARSNEKANVRSGDYEIWGPLHLLTTVDENQRPTNPRAEAVVHYIIGTLAPPSGLDLITLQAAEQLIPQCAMQVTRTIELGPALPFTPEQPCGCAYEEAANGTTACVPCQNTTQCAKSQICSFGYCESIAIPEDERSESASLPSGTPSTPAK